MVASTWPKTLQEAVVYFSNPETAHAEMVKFRWPDGVVRCPTCGSEKVWFTASRRVWQCAEGKHQRRQFTVKVGSIMEDSPLGIDKWLVAVWLITNAKNGISSYELGRAIGVTQKSAWFMLHRIRLAMHDDSTDMFKGHIEADETFIGGKARNMHADKKARILGKKGRSTVGKVAVMGLLQRHSEEGRSRVRAKVVPNTRRFALQSEIRERVELDGNRPSTPMPSSPTSLARSGVPAICISTRSSTTPRHTPTGNVHTNGLENFWSLVKRDAARALTSRSNRSICSVTSMSSAFDSILAS